MTHVESRDLNYRGQHSPPQWHAALEAVIALRAPRGLTACIGQGWRMALADVHATIARELHVDERQ